MAFNPNTFTEGAKPLPVLLLLDVSGSMDGEKISELNKAVRDMIADFKHEAQMETVIFLLLLLVVVQQNCRFLLHQFLVSKW